MLNQTEIEDLIYLRMPEPQARETIQALTPDRVTLETLKQFVQVIKASCEPIPALEIPVMDCCGTGGSGLPHYNTSTTVSFILAAGGVPVVKFGNRAMTSRTGSFDFLEALGFPAVFDVERLSEILAQSNLAFLYAPMCYPHFGALTALRRSLRTKTIFNYLGPLLNPAQPAFRLMGVSDATMQGILAQYLSETPAIRKAWVVRGENNLDEIGIEGRTFVHAVTPSRVEESHLDFPSQQHVIHPENRILSPRENVRIFARLLHGIDHHTPYHQISCLNAGAWFVIAGKTDSIEAGTAYANKLLQNGQVYETVEKCRRAYAHAAR